MRKTILIGILAFLSLYILFIIIDLHALIISFAHRHETGKEYIHSEEHIAALMISLIIVFFIQLQSRTKAKAKNMKIMALKTAIEICNTGIMLQITELALSDKRLGAILTDILKLVSTLPTIRVQAKGIVFLNEDRTLILTAHIGMEESPILKLCRKVPWGKCVCGRLAESCDAIMYSDDCSIAKGHDIQFEGMKPHGHLNIKIKTYAGKLLGVIALYTDIGYERNINDNQILLAVSNTLAMIVERKQKEEKIERLSLYDALTELPNRALFTDRLHAAISLSIRHESAIAVMFIDLDKFKPINDNLGHDAGDEILKEVARRGKIVFKREHETFARLSGDEFTALLPEIKGEKEVISLAKQLLLEFNKEFKIKKDTLQIEASIGIFIGQGNKNSLKLADKAMYKAKEKGGNTYFLIK